LGSQPPCVVATGPLGVVQKVSCHQQTQSEKEQQQQQQQQQQQ
jgi:hypothetical protein